MVMMVKERKRKERPLLEPVAEDGGSKFARALGSVDYHTRERGLQALTLWLSRKHDVGELELLKLWKGIFYCFWHSDKQPVQAALAERLSELMVQLPEQVALRYYTVFIKTLRREWFGIDHLRLDKFLMLIRQFFHQTMRLLQSRDWEAEQVQQFTSLWLHEVLLPQDTLVAAGLAYHLCDVLLPELGTVCSSGSGSGSTPQHTTLRSLLEPFCQALARTRDPALVYRLRQGVFDPLVEAVGEGSVPWDSLDVPALATHIFDLGAQPETRAKSREALYAISAALEKADKRRQRRAKEDGLVAVKAAGVSSQEPAAEAAAGGQQQAAAGKKKKKKKRSAEEAEVIALTPTHAAAAAVAEPPVASETTAAAPTPATKQKKKAKLAAPPGQPSAAQQDAAPTPHPLPQQQPPPSSAKKKRIAMTAAAAAAAPAGGKSTPLAGAPAPDAAVGTTGGKKNVRFSLRRNLVMTIGQPPLPEDVRTPPTSKPKGSALKVPMSGGTKLKAPDSAPGRLHGKQPIGSRSKLGTQQGSGGSKSASKAAGGTKRVLSLISPHTLSRPKAAQFF